MQSEQKLFLINMLFELLSEDERSPWQRTQAERTLRVLFDELLADYSRVHEESDESSDSEFISQHEHHDLCMPGFALLTLEKLNVTFNGKRKSALSFFDEGGEVFVRLDDSTFGKVTLLERGSKMLSAKIDDVWFDFDVSKFPKTWTRSLKAGLTYLVEEDDQ
jgi:hypothetical protein